MQRRSDRYHKEKLIILTLEVVSVSGFSFSKLASQRKANESDLVRQYLKLILPRRLDINAVFLIRRQ